MSRLFFVGRYLSAQLLTEPIEEGQHAKEERIYNFLHVPQKLERLLAFGYIICLDSFLYNLTVLPLRLFISLLSLAYSLLVRAVLRRWPVYNPLPCFKPDLQRGLIILLVSMLLHELIDSSRLYHSIRGQSVIKLYVIFNVFEIADRLCCSFGLDILDSYFANDRSPLLPSWLHFTLSVVYVFLHTVVLFYQAITLNVAINSFSNGLLTLLVSNQFVELKGAVFKRFEKENLFQLACADILERFQLSFFLLIIGLRNLSEVWSSSLNDLPRVLGELTGPLIVVYMSEILVDWLKHSFITKFNHIHPDVYVRYMQILCRDFQFGDLIDRSPMVSRRIGFSSFPLCCLVL